MNQDPFATLGIDRRFDVDADDLRRRFLSASTQMHPDRFPDALEQAQAVETMSELTEAYRVLTDPESRARALLALSGMEAKGDQDKLPAELLMDMMEVREEMESAIETNNATELDRLRTWANDRRTAHLEKLSMLFKVELDAPRAGKVRLELNALRYMQRMLEQMPA